MSAWERFRPFVTGNRRPIAAAYNRQKAARSGSSLLYFMEAEVLSEGAERVL